MNVALVVVLSILSLVSVLFTVRRYQTATAAQRPLILWAVLGAIAVPVTVLLLMVPR